MRTKIGEIKRGTSFAFFPRKMNDSIIIWLEKFDWIKILGWEPWEDYPEWKLISAIPHKKDDLKCVKKILKEIEDERNNQDDKWGQQDHPDGSGPQEKSECIGIENGKLSDFLREECDRSPKRKGIIFKIIEIKRN